MTGAVRELWGPLGAATATTLAAFVPLLLSKGATADFTRGIPVMIMLTLSVSYLLAVSVAPLVAARFLQPAPRVQKRWVAGLAGFLVRLSTGRPWTVIALGLALLLGSLALTPWMKLQFNSYRRIGIILVTVPLAAVGVIPGLVLTGQPFGFQSLLGVIAVVGIVVNNAIVLIDRIDQLLRQGSPVHEAVAEAVRRRTRPILLTTATTVAGLLPLAFSASTLWPPMAWAIISGLLASTVLTLLVVPALCVMVMRAPVHPAPTTLAPAHG